MEVEAFKEMIDFLNVAGFVAPQDVTMISNIYSRLPISRMKLEAHADDHMGMEADMSLLVSKYLWVQRKAEVRLEHREGELTDQYRKQELPAWATKGLIMYDAEYKRLREEVIDRMRVCDMLDYLKWSLNKRETLLNYYRKLDNN